MTIHLHIDRFVLEGLPISSTQGGALKAALSAELGRLLAEHSWNGPLRSEAMPYIRGSTFSPDQRDSTRQLGNKIARAVHGGFHRAG